MNVSNSILYCCLCRQFLAYFRSRRCRRLGSSGRCGWRFQIDHHRSKPAAQQSASVQDVSAASRYSDHDGRYWTSESTIRDTLLSWTNWWFYTSQADLTKHMVAVSILEARLWEKGKIIRTAHTCTNRLLWLVLATLKICSKFNLFQNRFPYLALFSLLSIGRIRCFLCCAQKTVKAYRPKWLCADTSLLQAYCKNAVVFFGDPHHLASGSWISTIRMIITWSGCLA